ncbi:Uncharacterised protein [Pseudomonas putida]|nr:Uncharacterised protein [Pseudomonas putida]CAB5537173.1 Uncharacterised protein [Pseudomonas putida]CAB5592001.1 Uncharacterised protein [Pseudomonas putida]CAB5594850.1 Uncharacterised protein [Pseudomonas putida]CAB5678434.1 Uncharacterised protein [Pseudomonas putida]
MYGFNVKWQTREQLPEIPQDMLFSGVARDTPEADPGHAPVMSTPVIRWGNSKACVFDDRVHHEQAWLVVYGDGQRLTGGRPLQGFRHIADIQEAASGVALRLIDANGHEVEISHLELDSLDGKEGRESEIEGLPVGIPFCLGHDHALLMADEKGVRIDSGPETLAMQWMFKDGKLSSVATGQVLGLGVRCLPPAQGLEKWHLSPEGVLAFGPQVQALCADPAHGEVWLQPQDPGLPSVRWQVKRPRNKASGMQVEKLVLHVQVCDDYSAGTSDSVYFSINGSRHQQHLARNFERGSALAAEVDLASMFQGRAIFADELVSVELYQVSGDGYGPAWRMNALDLVVNDHMSNRVLGSDSPWLLPTSGANWTGTINWLDWREEGGQTPLDFAGYTYPVNWGPLLSDWLNWRSYEPETLTGVCQLIGEYQGRLLAYDLKDKKPVYLEPNTAIDSYTWVYTPQGSIIIRRWDKTASRSSYIRHSQLGSGNPVVCAGELTITRVATHMAVQDLLGMINDASGHYLPDGGTCLAHVRERLAQLGLDTSSTQIRYRTQTPAM